MQNASEASHRAVRRLNDQFRKFGMGRGSLILTSGIDDRGPVFTWEAVAAVKAFDAFTHDNDPYGEHDFGAFSIQGERLFFKIDYYNLTLDGGSPDPADPAMTHRVLTIMLASEY